MSGAKLLVVEDDPHILVGLRDILTLDGYEVLTAENGRQGLEILQRELLAPPDLIVSDIMMPLMDGLEFLKKVRGQSQWVKIPFIFLTAKGEKTDVQQGKVLGVDDYLIKPFDPDDLLIAVEAKLKRHREIDAVQAGQIAELKRHILTILNHEFRTPLTLVVAYADMLKEYNVESMTEIELLDFLKGVNSGAERLRRLIENFILLVELETGDAERTYAWRRGEVYNLPDVIYTAHRQAVTSETRDRVVEITITDPLPAIIGDHEYLVVAVRELIDNALKFSPPDKPVRIQARQEGQTIRIIVEDEGRGIPMSEVEHIWQNFYQIKRDFYENQGTGTGLALVRDIMKLHKGIASVETSEGKGCCFTLSLPVAPPHELAGQVNHALTTAGEIAARHKTGQLVPPSAAPTAPVAPTVTVTPATPDPK